MIHCCTGSGARGLESSACTAAGSNPFEEAREKLDVADQDQVVDRTGVRNDQPHRYSPMLFKAARSCSKSSMV